MRPQSHHRPFERQKRHSKFRCNGQITAPEVRLILEEGKTEILPIQRAKTLAREQGLDLVEVAPTAKPPVCRIIELGKLLYEEEKKHKAHKQPKLKEIDFHVTIAEHDLETKIRAAQRFLEEGHSLVLKVLYRKRENAHPEIGIALLEKIRSILSPYGNTTTPTKNGTVAILRIQPRHHPHQGLSQQQDQHQNHHTSSPGTKGKKDQSPSLSN